MDDTVNNFLKEINEIVPPSSTNRENAWKECFDKQSGFPYYWNLQTDEVTWEMPEEYKTSQEKNKHNNKKTSLYIPPKTFPASSVPVPCESVKIYKIESENTKPPFARPSIVQKKTSEVKRISVKKSIDADDDEKITLISCYGGDSESEEEEEEATTAQVVSIRKSHHNFIIEVIQKNNLESEKHTIKKLQNKLKDLKDLETLPLEVKNPNESKIETKKEISGFRLVAGYSSDEDENGSEDELDEKPRSTLFPIQESVNLEQLKTLEPPIIEKDPIDTKIFQRKRKIDIDVVNAQNKPKLLKTNETDEQKPISYTDYLGFKSGGVMFAKGEKSPQTKESNHETQNESSNGKHNFLEFEEDKTTLSEKLSFLSEGHPTVSPVQTMLIQVETLYAALKQGSLNAKYFKDWLTDTCADLIKLEQEAAPSGWLLQWDRLNKRYFYQNKATGESQWEYPQPDVIRCDEAMDISTTPPPLPAEEDEDSCGANLEPPPPPKIRGGSPQPPPPPVISLQNEKSSMSGTNSPSHEHLLQFPQLPSQSNEPLPPGVDKIDLPATKAVTSGADNLKSALSSFYSEMASITSTTSTATSDSTQVEISDGTVSESVTDKVKKKKKAKVKIAQGLAMKKKGVSKLVEKWKHVQSNY